MTWISVEERLPNKDEMSTKKPVLGWDNKWRGYCLLWAEYMFRDWQVTFWQPLPPEPESKEIRETE